MSRVRTPACLIAFFAIQIACATYSADAQVASPTKVCTLSFAKDARRPARPEDDALPCLLHAAKLLSADPSVDLYLVATADSHKDNHAGNGRSRTEQDMSGEDLRYADVAAYRAINTKAYLVRWMHVNPRRIVPLTAYEEGQWLTIYAVPKRAALHTIFSDKTAPIMERPCTVKPCAVNLEEFLIAQQRAPMHK